ncbi:MAG TPA: rod shape-determining protein RodA [Polyangia bacterium]|nr:rod shape-determining protein RodA [Polyangia bacterium]
MTLSAAPVLRRLRSYFDWPLAATTLAILALGLVNLYSATLAVRPALFYHQLGWLLLGVLVFVAVAAIDYRTFNRLGYVGWLLGVAALVAVWKLGHSSHGARRWIVIAGQWIQPSEFVKLLVVVALAKYAHDAAAGAVSPARRWLLPTACIAVPALLVLKQPDLGTALLFVLLFASVMAVVDLPYLAVVAGASLVGSPILWFFGLKDYQKQRLLSFLDPNRDPAGAGWHARQSIFAIGSGRLFGKGYLHGTQNQLNFLPEHWTDFPFAVWAEEWGFFGCTVLLLLYLFLVLWLVNLARQARDRFGAVACVGVAALLFWQVVVNVGMVTGILPVVGVTLPLFSYGGSSMLTVMAALGLAMNVSVRRSSY